MRLSILEKGHRWPQKAALAVMRVVGRGQPDPVVKAVFHRPEFFGRPWMRFVESTMRGQSEWTPGQRELLAAFVSKLNECPFCVGVHSGIAELQLGGETEVDKLDHWRDAGFEPKLAAALELLERTAGRTAQVDSVREHTQGSEAGLEDALYVGFVFNTINRLANAFDFQWTDDADRMRLAKGLNEIAYSVPAFLLR